MRFVLAVLPLVPFLPFVSGCSAVSAHRSIDVKNYGTLFSVHREGDVSAKVALADVVPGPKCFAVGALEGMKGEITIADDQVWVSKPIVTAGERRVTTTCTTTSAERAALLVTAKVNRWKRITVTEDVPASGFDDFVARAAAREGIDVAQPFPFLVDGSLVALEFHVVDGTQLSKTGSPPEHHADSGVREKRDRVDARLVGFYAASGQGVIVHHDSATHVHVVLESPGITGHVDAVGLAKGSVISLPFD